MSPAKDKLNKLITYHATKTKTTSKEKYEAGILLADLLNPEKIQFHFRPWPKGEQQ